MRDLLEDIFAGELASGGAIADPVASARKSLQKQWPKKFYQVVSVEKVLGEGGVENFGIALDDKFVRTPSRKILAVAEADLAAMVAEEWTAQDTHIVLASMSLTRLVMGALERSPAQNEAMREEIIRYGAHDLICYRASFPEPLVKLQSAQWDALLAFALQRFDAPLFTTTSLQAITQPQNSLTRLAAPMRAVGSPLLLAALHSIAVLSGSLVITLAVLENHLTSEEAFNAAHVEDAFSKAQWGEDAEAAHRSENRRRDFLAAGQVVGMVVGIKFYD